jgi:formylglycine-generating enzyme required for sulfatase activity
MGSPPTEAGRDGDAAGKVERRHRQSIDRSFALAAHEITVAQFLEFRRQQVYRPEKARNEDCPINGVTWYDAAAYCRWLSVKERVPEDQMCYPPVEVIDRAAQRRERLVLPADYLSRTGYRLPTEAEWEYACRAGALTSRYYGETEELLGEYAWYTKNSHDEALLPVGRLKPNDLGLFDMLGNAWEWCHDPSFYYRRNLQGNEVKDLEYDRIIFYGEGGVLRGGGFAYHAGGARSATRNLSPRENRGFDFGFRVARTFR